jgi:hypothetical protein
LSASTSIDTGEINDISRMDMSSDGFNFVAIVPEPSSLAMLLATGSLLLRRRKVPLH